MANLFPAKTFEAVKRRVALLEVRGRGRRSGADLSSLTASLRRMQASKPEALSPQPTSSKSSGLRCGAVFASGKGAALQD